MSTQYCGHEKFIQILIGKPKSKIKFVISCCRLLYNKKNVTFILRV